MAAWNVKRRPVYQPTSNNKDDDVAVARINRMIVDENNKIEQYQLEIGKKYTQLHETDFEEDFAAPMNGIAASRRKLEEYSLQMQFVTGIIICTNCGHKAPKDSVYCNMCATKLPILNFDRYEMCGNCGTLVEKGASVCPNCACPVNREKKNLVQCSKCKEFVENKNRFCPICGEALFPNNSFETEETPKGKACSNCGAVMTPDNMFCTECGSKLK